jgi:hypothetical protein
MGYPDLSSDESIILSTQNIVVKSVLFEAILTNKRFILIDSKKNLIPPQNILLSSIRHVEAGENAIRDPIITLTIIADSGVPRQMILTFSGKIRGERKRECDEWTRTLKEQIAFHLSQESRISVAAGFQEQPTDPGIAPVSRAGTAGGPAAKKKIEIARPITKITETSPLPIESGDAGLPLPEGTFCSRCGNRVPPESAFCNRCGSKIVHHIEQVKIQEPTAPVPREPDLPAPVSPAEQKERPIEKVIQEIEPLIVDSKPRTEPAPLVPRHIIPQSATGSADSTSSQQKYIPFPKIFKKKDQLLQPEVLQPADTVIAEKDISSQGTSATPSLTTEPSGSSMEEITRAALAAIKEQSGSADKEITPSPPVTEPSVSLPQIGIPPVAPSPPQPPKKPAPASRKPAYIALVIIVFVICAIVGVVLIKPDILTGLQEANVTTTPAPTVTATTIVKQTPPTPTSTPTPIISPSPSETPKLIIPETGVWLKIVYQQTFSGDFGLPGRQRSVTDTGEKIYQIPVVNDPVEVTIQKEDGSADELTVEMYKDGKLIKRATTRTPHGVVEFQIDLKNV